ncbi:MAG TPA: VWA domain-containing protein, partial [Myxococcales bacterium]|nr:VWA domain-containing protein [Myxococcales bacterium]
CSECKRAQPSVVLLIDKSQSMKVATATGNSRWDETFEALKSLLADYDWRINLGAKFYPTTDPDDACLVSSGLDLDFHSSFELLRDTMFAITPSGQTPMAAALQQALIAYSSAAAKAETGNKYVLVITDGLETCSGDAGLMISALRDIGVLTVIVAFDSAGVIAPLTSLSVKGGLPIPRTAVSDKVYISAVDASSVKTAIKQALDMTLLERCDGQDDNCSGQEDDNAPDLACNLTCNAGVGGVQKCSNGKYIGCSEYVKVEICDSKDNDCDGLVDEEWSNLGSVCTVGKGECFSTGKYECNADQQSTEVCNATVITPIEEFCNLKDDDCDGLVDEYVTKSCDTSCGAGTAACNNGVFTDCTAPPPKEETCNGIDDDCNGAIDDVVPVACSGVCGNGFQVCEAGKITGCSADAAPEICDGKDNDCDGFIDEGGDGNTLIVSCDVGNGLAGECGKGTQNCVNGVLQTCIANELPVAEVCDGKDNDCNGKIDDTTNGTPITVACYDGPGGTQGVGVCLPGLRTCLGDGSLGVCIGAVVPGIEVCNGKDDDCDSATDENASDICILEKPAVCSAGLCLCGQGDNGVWQCYLD